MTVDAVGAFGLTFDFLLKNCLSILWRTACIKSFEKSKNFKYSPGLNTNNCQWNLKRIHGLGIMICQFVVIIRTVYCCFWKVRIGILLPKLFWPTVRKKCSSDQENILKFEAEAWRLRICKNFESTRTICWNSEGSEQFLV